MGSDLVNEQNVQAEQLMDNQVQKNLSITGKVWRERTDNDRESMRLAQQLNMSEITGRILVGRGVVDLNDALNFISPKMVELLDPSHLLDMDIAVERLIVAIKEKQKIAIFGDYDVDGACSTAILVRFFRSVGMDDPLIYIPDRIKEGYGPNPQAMDKLKEMGAEVVITVDCGSVAFEALEHAQKTGLEVIITDHHQTTPERPKCVAMINPNRVDETSPYTMLSGGGVAFYLVLAMTRALRNDGFFAKKGEDGIAEPDNRKLLDLVAVSSICDMVPLTGANRILVKQGLKVLNTRGNIGLAALVAVSTKGDDGKASFEKLGAYHVGFQIGPRINAGGRVAECDLGARLLSTENPDEARQLSQRLDIFNDERKEIETQVQEEAMAIASQQFSEDNKSEVLVVAGEGWHEGVIGIVASRVKEKFNRPTFIISINKEAGTAKGSGRSISGVDIGKAVVDCKKSGVITKGGGHKMAAGVSLDVDKVDEFRKQLQESVRKQIGKLDSQSGEYEVSAEAFVAGIGVDGLLSSSAVNENLGETLERLEPYGAGNPEPRFVFTNARVLFAKAVGAEQRHLQLSFNCGLGSETVRGIVFGAMENQLGPFLLKAMQSKENITLCGVVRRNEWQGRVTYQIQVNDAKSLSDN